MRAEKKYAVEELKNLIEQSNYLIFTDYSGVGAEKMNLLRNRLHKNSSRYMVVKNRLFALAARTYGLEEANNLFGGQVGVIFAQEESSIPVLRALVDFSKEYKVVKILGGIFDGRKYPAEKLIQWARLPSKEILQAKAMGTIKAPLTQFVGVLWCQFQHLVCILKAIAEKKGAE